ncbi:PilN domain-containing protein [bacterium]|nr:PilN domain-containing protein [bacterium]
MVKINLLPLKIRKTKGMIKLYTYLLIGGSAGTLVLVLLVLGLMVQTHRIEAKLKRIASAEELFSERVQELRKIIGQEQQAQKSRVLLEKLMIRHTIWISILDELANVVRDDMWLTRLQSQRKADAGLELAMEGRAYNKITVADFLTALERSALFSDIGLGSLTEVKDQEQSQVQFKLTLNAVGVNFQAGEKL